ncbi:MAG: hypothetical protein JSU57_00105, partial [Candidatus Heimdallarchaeota archaeon]
EEDEGFGTAFNQTDIHGLASNLLIAMVMPKDEKAGTDEPSYPTPIVNVSTTWIDDDDEGIENGEIIEIKTKITNLGDEPTTIKVISYFPTRMASIDLSGSYNGENFRVTDISDNTITDYDKAFLIGNDLLGFNISAVAVGGLHLAPTASIIFYYKIKVTDIDSLILPPVAVEYDSRYPMAGASGMEGSGEVGEETSPFAISTSLNTKSRIESTNIRFSIQAGETSGSTWTSYSSSSLLSAYAAVTPPEETSTTSATTGTSGPPTSITTGANGFTTLTSFMSENMRLMIVLLAIPIVVLSVREFRRTRK